MDVNLRESFARGVGKAAPNFEGSVFARVREQLEKRAQASMDGPADAFAAALGIMNVATAAAPPQDFGSEIVFASKQSVPERTVAPFVAESAFKAASRAGREGFEIGGAVKKCWITFADEVLRTLADARCPVPAQFIPRLLRFAYSRAAHIAPKVAATLGGALCEEYVANELRPRRFNRFAPVFLTPETFPKDFNFKRTEACVRKGKSKSTRLDALRTLATFAPERAARAFAKSWKSVSPEEREKSLEILELNPTRSYRKLYRAILKDAAVATQGAKYHIYNGLAKIAGLKYGAKIREAAADILRLKGEVDLPSEKTIKSLAGLCAFWSDAKDKTSAPTDAARIILGRAPLSLWEEKFGKSPKEILELFREDANFESVLQGLRDSWRLFGGSESWAEALAFAKSCCYDVDMIDANTQPAPFVDRDGLVFIYEIMSQRGIDPKLPDGFSRDALDKLRWLYVNWDASIPQEKEAVQRLLSHQHSCLAAFYAHFAPKPLSSDYNYSAEPMPRRPKEGVESESDFYRRFVLQQASEIIANSGNTVCFFGVDPKGILDKGRASSADNSRSLCRFMLHVLLFAPSVRDIAPSLGRLDCSPELLDADKTGSSVSPLSVGAGTCWPQKTGKDGAKNQLLKKSIERGRLLEELDCVIDFAQNERRTRN